MRKSKKQEIIKLKLEEIKKYEDGENYYNEKYQQAFKMYKMYKKELQECQGDLERQSFLEHKIKEEKNKINDYQLLMNEQHSMLEKLKNDIASL